MRVVDNLYAYLWPGVTMMEMQRYGNNCNSYLIANTLSGGKHVLIDPGQTANESGQRCLDRLFLEMDNDGIKVEDIGLLIYTHAHPDHYEAGPTIKQMSNAQVATSKTEVEFVEAMKKQMGSQLEAMGIKMPKIESDFYLQEGDLELGEGKLKLQVFNTPGHSPGHLGIYWPAMKAFFGGDLIFNGSTGRVDLPGGSAQAIKQSIERVSQLEIEYLLTGHQYGAPGIVQGKQNIKENYEFVRKNIYPYL